MCGRRGAFEVLLSAVVVGATGLAVLIRLDGADVRQDAREAHHDARLDELERTVTLAVDEVAALHGVPGPG